MMDKDETRLLSVPTTDELDELVPILGERFIRRWDLYARQLDDGRYVCVREPLRPEYLKAHLKGNMTLGAYVLDEQSWGRHLVFDADDTSTWRQLRALAGVLGEMGTVSYLERSRRGGHLWLFFDSLLSGESIRRFGQGLTLYFSLADLELFPKQDQLTSGPGSLIRLPFGVHRRTGRRYGFCGRNGQPLAPLLREQLRILAVPQTVPGEVVERFSAYVPIRQRRAPLKPLGDKGSGSNSTDVPLHEQVKAAISVRDFVSHYVELSASGMGLCPFHNDHVDSFSVNDERNFWYCFACEIGGSVIDFWMHYRECDFHSAVKELADILL